MGDLQSALTLAELQNDDADPANDVSEIRIAGGTYRPTLQSTPGTSRSETFALVDGVSLLGGFAGLTPEGDDLADARDVDVYETVLTGDLLNNDAPDDDTTKEDNAWTVVFAEGLTTETILDGLTTTAGRATDTDYRNPAHWSKGGGVYLESGPLTLRNSTVVGNEAGAGGGIYSASGTLLLEHVEISSNIAGGSGGGLHSYSPFPVVIRNTTIADNSSGGRGGGINYGGLHTLDNGLLDQQQPYFQF